MASQPEVSEVSSTLERLVRNRDLSLFLPFIVGFSDHLRRRSEERQQEQDQQNDNQTNNNRVILINPFTQGMVVIEGGSSLDSLLRELAGNSAKDGQPPASKSAIEAMPRVEISEEEECVICLEGFFAGGLAKEMPCKHRFHVECIEKWLGIHGSCPVCRHKMPVDEEESESKTRVFEREIWVSFSFNNNRRSGAEEEEEVEVEESNQSGSTGDDNGAQVDG